MMVRCPASSPRLLGDGFVDADDSHAALSISIEPA